MVGSERLADTMALKLYHVFQIERPIDWDLLNRLIFAGFAYYLLIKGGSGGHVEGSQRVIIWRGLYIIARFRRSQVYK